VFAVLAAACGGSPNRPTPTFSLECPPRADAATPSFGGTEVSFEVTPIGGRPPAAVVCTPASGSTFPIGDTTVSCTATDAASQTTSCSFPVVVTRTPTLAWTRFLAFGDSITEGKTSAAPDVLWQLDFPDAYPGQLQQMLAARYAAQTIDVLNRGRGGETLPDGRRRLPGVLDADQPEVLLLLEGVNNIAGLTRTGRDLAADLENMVREARRRNIQVLIATLLPVGDQWEARFPGTQEAIRTLNEKIPRIAARNDLGSPVDLYTVFSQAPSLLGMDGVHPTPTGYTRMAEVFFDAIAQRYEIDEPPPAAARGVH
jgi:lysophospholipase L1-like esterase